MRSIYPVIIFLSKNELIFGSMATDSGSIDSGSVATDNLLINLPQELLEHVIGFTVAKYYESGNVQLLTKNDGSLNLQSIGRLKQCCRELNDRINLDNFVKEICEPSDLIKYCTEGSSCKYQAICIGGFTAKHGLFECWYGNDQMICESQTGLIMYRKYYRNNRLHGEYKSWYITGQLASMEIYEDGKLHGSRKLWHKNGTLKVDSYYKNGYIDGLRVEWHDNGSVDCKTNYVDGVCCGLYEAYSYSGRLLCRYNK